MNELDQPVYRSLLGPEWYALNPAIRSAHADDKIVRSYGRFRVSHGSGMINRLAARVLRLPAEGEDVATHLEIIPELNGERWERTFGSCRLTTFQYASNGVLVEKIGLLELLFRLRVTEGMLSYIQAGCRLRFGSVSIRLPRWLSPRVRGSEKATAIGTEVHVEVDLPIIGRLIQYEGTMEIEP